MVAPSARRGCAGGAAVELGGVSPIGSNACCHRIARALFRTQNTRTSRKRSRSRRADSQAPKNVCMCGTTRRRADDHAQVDGHAQAHSVSCNTT